MSFLLGLSSICLVFFVWKYGKCERFFLLLLNSWFFSTGIFLFLRHCPKCLFFLGKKKEGNKLSVLVRLCDAICFLLINEKAYAAVADIVCLDWIEFGTKAALLIMILFTIGVFCCHDVYIQ